LAEATGIPAGDLNSRLSGDEELTVDQLAIAGGFLHARASTLIGASA
jgi:uncharacterized protein YaaQ